MFCFDSFIKYCIALSLGFYREYEGLFAVSVWIVSMLGSSEFCTWVLFLLTPFTCCLLFLFVEAVRGLRIERKKQEYLYKKLATIVEGNQKAPFSTATTPRCRGGRYSFPWIAPLYPWYIPCIAECWARRYQVPFLKSLVWLDLGLNPGLLNHWRILYSLSQPLYSNFILEFMKTIQVRWTRHAGYCWKSRDELISNVLLWTPSYGRTKAGWPAQTYIQQLCENTGCSSEDLPEAMNDREEWRERVRDIRAGGTTWWWWWWLFCD